MSSCKEKKITPRHLLTHKSAKEELGKVDIEQCECCGKRRVCYLWVSGECLECIKEWEFEDENESI